MTRTTIDFGIDLGTTNSEIAVLRGMEVQVFKDNDGFENTPSAVWLNQKGALVVGRRAKERLLGESDLGNAFCEFKLQMGTDADYTFQRNGRRMKAEDLSAEVLKELKDNVQKTTGEDVGAAVITVPAAFESRQCDATNNAARLAGLTVSPLLMEPVAAALAYGFQKYDHNAYWFVYDFGGGTFDAAIIHVRDGMIRVVNHEGDNHLGGKLIDWSIVEDLFIPALIKERHLTDFNRANMNKWGAAIGKLKVEAEMAKIRLSREESVEVFLEKLCMDDRGEYVDFEYELHRSELERISSPFIRRSLNLCRKTLAAERLGSESIEKVLLVGGTTLMPIFRDTLSDPKEGLGIPLEYRVDPITVVARGAAVFAGTQRLQGMVSKPVRKGQYALQLEYQPISSDPEPLVSGTVLAADNETLAGFTIEFVNTGATPLWRSGKIALTPAGAFMGNLLAEKDRQNVFEIELRDSKGNKCEVTPCSFHITPGISVTEQPLIHSIGVAMANNETDPIFEKGSPLPLRKRRVHKNVYPIVKGQDGIIRIPVIEGENIGRADRNKLLGALVIPARNVKMDLPAGSDVEITIVIDESRIIRVKAYIPILDEEYEEVLEYDPGTPDPEKLAKEVAAEKKRLAEVRKKAAGMNDLRAKQILGRIETENMENEIDKALAASRADRDAADKCKCRLLDLKVAIDEVEDALEWPALLAEAEETITQSQSVVQQYGSNSDKQTLSYLDRETRRAMESRNPDILRQKIDELASLQIKVLLERPEFWIARVDYLKGKKSTMRDQPQAELFFIQAAKAININNLIELKAVVRQLTMLLPVEEQQKVIGYGGTTIRC